MAARRWEPIIPIFLSLVSLQATWRTTPTQNYRAILFSLVIVPSCHIMYEEREEELANYKRVS